MEFKQRTMNRIRKYRAVFLCILLCGCSLPEQEALEENSSGPAQTVAQTQKEPESESLTEKASQVQREPEIQTVTITAVGDCTLGPNQKQGYAGSFHEYYDKYGEDYFFDGVRDIFSSDDFTLVNLECVLSTSDNRVEKTWNMKGKPEYTGILTNSSVEGCSLGNNHTFDYGQQGLDDTRQALNDAGLVFGFNEHTAVYTAESGIVIGLVSASLLSADKTHEEYIKKGIKKLRKKGVDLVIASCHWGIEGEHYPNSYQKQLSHKIIDWGADVLIGSHPHVLQGVELYKGKVICYSLGNFCFGGNRNPADKDTVIYQQTFTFVDHILQDGLQADIIPCRLSSTDSRNDFRPAAVTGKRKKSILSKMNEYSSPYSGVEFDSTGNLGIREEKK